MQASGQLLLPATPCHPLPPPSRLATNWRPLWIFIRTHMLAFYGWAGQQRQPPPGTSCCLFTRAAGEKNVNPQCEKKRHWGRESSILSSRLSANSHAHVCTATYSPSLPQQALATTDLGLTPPTLYLLWLPPLSVKKFQDNESNRPNERWWVRKKAA